jgi:predicted lipid-binding transport protein (Tim44 family)
MMKSFLWMMVVAVGVGLTLAPTDADAKRLGGGKSTGMQRTAPDKPAPSTPDKAAQNTPASPAAAPNTAGAAAAAAAPKRSWLGPIAGLAAGLGLAALFSHFGMGEGLANFAMMALLLMAAFFVIRFLMRRFAGGGAQGPMAMAGAGAAVQPAAPPSFVDERPGMQRNAAPSVAIGSALTPPLAVSGLSTEAAAPVLPANFDAEGFERLAKMLFIRLQAANDKADLNDLRNFTTPELFAALRMDLQDRGDKTQQPTDVVKIDAKLIDFAQEAEQQIVSVRFTGLIKEDGAGEATPFDEVWHVVKPLGDSRNWAIAGIQQRQ